MNKDMPAMPQPITHDNAGGITLTSEYCDEAGLTKAEYIKAHAPPMPEWFANSYSLSFSGTAYEKLCQVQKHWLEFYVFAVLGEEDE